MGIPLLQEKNVFYRISYDNLSELGSNPKLGRPPQKNAIFSNQKFHSTTEEVSFFFGGGKTKKRAPRSRMLRDPTNHFRDPTNHFCWVISIDFQLISKILIFQDPCSTSIFWGLTMTQWGFTTAGSPSMLGRSGIRFQRLNMRSPRKWTNDGSFKITSKRNLELW